MAFKASTCIILVGKTGNGKSSTGNSILNKRVFEDEPSAGSVTEKCSIKENEVNGEVFTVVDTPGIFDSKKTVFATALEVQRSLQMLERIGKKPHVFLLIMSITSRFTEEEKMTIDYLRMIFGDEMVKRTIIVFTSKERLRGKSLHKFLDGAEFEKVMAEFGDRVVALENTSRDGVEDLYDMIAMVQKLEKAYDDDWRSHKKALEDMVKQGSDVSSEDLYHKLTSAIERISEIRRADKRWKQAMYYGKMALGTAAVIGAVVAKLKIK